MVKLCEWLSKVTGKEWRLPTNAEWETAVGTSSYPWGDDFPPHWDDGNYSITADGKRDAAQVGVDGIKGTAPVASFKPNALGFYDLGGNAWEWMWDEADSRTGNHVLRGSGWHAIGRETATPTRAGDGAPIKAGDINRGLRLVRKQ